MGKHWLTTIKTDAAQLIAGWYNPLTGQGDPSKDKSAAASFERGILINERDLASLFTWNPLARAICLALPEWGLRNGWDLTTGGDAVSSQSLETAIRKRYVELGAHEVMLRAAVWGQTFGGGLVLVGANDGRLTEEPLDEGNIQSIDWFRVVPRSRALVHAVYSAPAKADFGEAAIYKVRESGANGEWVDSLIHESRVIRWPGPITDDDIRLGNKRWDQSILDVVVGALRAHDGMWGDVGAMTKDGSQGVWMIQGLAKAAATGLGQHIQDRFDLASIARSVFGVLLLDADKEDFKYVERGYAGISDLLGQSAVRTAGAAQIPATVLMGQSPAGLNATGESDLELWYARIWAWDTGVAASRIERLVRLLLLAKDGPTQGKEPERWAVALRDPRRLSPMKQHEIRARQAQTDVAYITGKVLTPEEVAINRFSADGWSDLTQIDLGWRRDFLAFAKEEIGTHPNEIFGGALERWLALAPAGVQDPSASGAAIIKAPSGAEAPQDINKRATDAHDRVVRARSLEQGRARADAAGLRFDAHDGVAVMVRVPPALAALLALEGGEPPDSLHITLAYLGKLGPEVLAADVERVARAVRDVAATIHPLAGIIGGLGRFPASSTSNDLDVLVALVDVPELGVLRAELVQVLDALGVPARKDHDFTAHVTLAYLAPGAPLPIQSIAPRPFGITELELWIGDVRKIYPLGSEGGAF